MVPLSVDEKGGPLVPNPVQDLAVNTSLGPQIDEDVILCTRLQSLLLFTLQMVIPFLSPVTVHLKVKVSPGQVGGGAVNCPATSPGDRPMRGNIFLLYAHSHTHNYNRISYRN